MVLIIIILCLLWKIRVLKARLLSKTCQELISLTVKAEAVSESFAETRLYEEICERNDVVLKTNEAYACAYTVETARNNKGRRSDMFKEQIVTQMADRLGN